MRFKVDENLHVEIAALRRERGHDAKHVSLFYKKAFLALFWEKVEVYYDHY